MKSIMVPIEQKEAEIMCGFDPGTMRGWKIVEIPMRDDVAAPNISEEDLPAFIEMIRQVRIEAMSQGFTLPASLPFEIRHTLQ